MTDWKIQGGLPPLSEEDWTREFERYKEFPEWEQRQSMSLPEFKTIYWWEYGHRMAGRAVGLAFCGPLVYFGARGFIPDALKGRLALLLGLGATQGLVGWWMVRSGLEEELRGQSKEIRVSPYRLATHLGLAFSTYSLLLWTALDVFDSPTPKLLAPPLVRGLSLAACGVVFATAVSGAFVAGNDAGRAYNTFPKMGDDWIPDGITRLHPLYRNLAENTAAVQLQHRLLAAASTTSVIALLAAARPHWAALPAAFRHASVAAGLALTAQVSLGIATLLLYVPLPLAAAHQLGSLLLLTTTIKAAHAVRTSSGSLLAVGLVAGGVLPLAGGGLLFAES
eukprot:CAMPEP_0197393732 /NCGR_PEP_ID=MMETSP1165-20131217/4487_1 /TAXON_ID=284809 /ORGANISM="Chrysocystis fragilis, Strain CCMP3189" /LENGTH=336 /DNA_ID=CAMNT_0042919409 /DNA_START=228 /DNA_END=1234 /DNA_ORIENTATION=+